VDVPDNGKRTSLVNLVYNIHTTIYTLA